MHCQIIANVIQEPQNLPIVFGNVSNFHLLTNPELANYGWYPFMQTAPPIINPAVQKLTERRTFSGVVILQSWSASTMTAAEALGYLKSQKAIFKQLLNQHMDAQVAPRDFDNISTAITWPDSTIPQWAADGAAAKTFREQCYVVAYKIETDVLAGLRSLPTPAQFIAEMPILWAPPPSNGNGPLV